MRDVYEQVARMVGEGRPGVVATVVRTEGSTPRKVGAKMVIAEDGRTWGTIGGGSVEAAVVSAAGDVLREGGARAIHYELKEGTAGPDAICGGAMDVLLEPLPVAQALYIFGAGHVGRALAEIARPVGFRVVVIDCRPELATRERLPTADQILVADFVEAARGLPVGPEVSAVVVTPDHAHDEDVVRVLVDRPCGYLGMIGSRKKVATLRERLKSSGVAEEAIERLHAPIGLDIGAETPEEIAVSILAELVAVRRKERK